jgi:Transcriptional activator of glycolytic enzymes
MSSNHFVCFSKAVAMQEMLNSTLAAHVQSQAELQKKDVALEIARVALEHILRSGGGGAAATPPQRPPSPLAAPAAEDPGPDDERDDVTIYKHATIHQRNQPTSVSSIYEEYYGIGNFKDRPMVGGFAGLEEKFKMKWREGDTSYNRAFLRMKQIVDCIDNEATTSGRPVADVLKQIDELFIANTCNSTAKVIRILQEENLIPKRARRAEPTPPLPV